MIYREQYLKNCAQALGYLDNTDISQISSSNVNIEEYLRTQKVIAQSHLNYLKLLFIKYVFLVVTKNLSAIQQSQIDTIFKNDIKNIKNNIHPQFGNFEKKITQHSSFSQVIPSLQQILTVEEMKILEFMLGKSQAVPRQPVSSSDTQKGVSTSGEPVSQKLEGIPAILGDYRILEIIGAGGMGKVFKAFHQNLERVVAVKVMLSQTEIARKRFLVEAKLTAKMQHPNIIPIHDIKSEGKLDYIVMDFIQGDTLSSALEKEKLSFAKTIEIIKPIISAVAYAHRYQVIHRDLKPSNILLEDGTFRPIVMDFGLAKQLDENVDDKITMSGQILGSPRYMAPEQADAQEVDYRADIYALGTIFYEMLTGKPAIEGGSLAQIIYQITQEKYLPPREVNPEIPVEIEKICLKAMTKNREERYQTADTFLEAIEQFVNHGNSIAETSSTITRNQNKKPEKRKLQNTSRSSTMINVRNSRDSIVGNRKTASMRMTQRQQKIQKNNSKLIIAVSTLAGVVIFTLILFLLQGNQQQSIDEARLQAEKEALENELAKKEFEKEKQKLEDDLQRQKDKLEKQKLEDDLQRQKDNLEKQKLEDDLQRQKDKLEKQKLEDDLQRQKDKLEKQKLGEQLNQNDNDKLEKQKLEEQLKQAKEQTRLEQEKKLESYLEYNDNGNHILIRVKKVTPALQNIDREKKPITISFRGIHLEDEDLRYIQNVKNIVGLDLKKTNVGDAALKYVATLKNLRTLDLQDTNVTGEGLQHLDNLRLKEIDLDNTQINDDNVHYLKSIYNDNLKEIQLEETQITDKSIDILSSFKFLRKLKIKRTSITQIGFFKLKSLMLGCDIEYY